MRINKYLALCGVASRRESDKIIEEKRVKLNGRIVTKLGTEINESYDIVHVDGKQVKPAKKMIYIMLHKPKGYITSVSDEKGRKTVMDLIGKYADARLFPIGRLDYDSEGLLLLTNDGDLAYKLTHPKSEIGKTYVARVSGKITENDIKTLEKGVIIDGQKTLPCKATLIETDGHKSRVEITITEGKNRQVRKMFEQVLEKEVEFLKRTAIGKLKLGGLTRGTFRELKPSEISYLKSI